MIKSNKSANGLRALQAIMIEARTLAYEERDFSLIAKLMDGAEYLAALMLETGDRTTEFRDYLRGMVEQYGCGIAWAEFERGNDNVT